MLVLSRKENQAIVIDETIEIVIQEINKDSIKLAIIAPKEVKILRKELLEQTIEVNQAAIPTLDSETLKTFFNIERKKDTHD